jgi:hypothetical protein
MAFRDPVIVRRSRRRRRLVVLSLLGVVVVVFVLALRYQSEQRQTIEYLNAASAIAEDHEEMSLLLADLFGRLGDSDREEILTRLDGLSRQALEVDAMVEELTVTPTVAVVHGRLVVAHGAWKSAIDSSGPVIVQVLDAVDDERNADRQLQATFVQLLVGDRAYADMLTTLEEIDAEFDPFPEFAYVGPERTTLYDAALIGSRLRAVTDLVETHDVAVTVALDPEPAGDSDGTLLVPNTGSFSVLVVVSNNSNVQEAGIEVLLQLLTAEGEPITVGELVPALEPGESVSVDFRELQVVAGVDYELLVAATVADDIAPENNSAGLTFSINADT